MATTPRISNSNPLSPVNRMATLGSVGKQDSLPVEEIDQYSAVVNRGANFYYENLVGEEEHPHQRRKYQVQTPRRSIKSALIRGTTESFASAFSSILVENDSSSIGLGGKPRTSMASGIGTYEATARVIKQITQPRGESMNFDV